jgi:hypothetical protein
MKIKNNQSGVAHIAIVLLIVVVLGVAGFVGWKVWDIRKDSSKIKDTAPVNTSSQDTNTSNKKTEAGTGIEISSLGIKINDPESRGLVLETSEICEDSCTKVDLIRDNNDSYFNECKYVASIRKIVDNDNPMADMKSTDYYYPLTKKVGSNWYQVRTGSNFQSSCKNNSDGTNPNEAYEKSIRLYIANNIVAL